MTLEELRDKTLEQIADHYEYADFQALDPKAFMSALRAAEQRGIERAYEACKQLGNNGGPVQLDVIYDKDDCLRAIRTLAQGGDKI